MINEKHKVEKENAKFADYVTNTAFNISLSKQMVKILMALYGSVDVTDERLVLTPYLSLERRGLAKHVDGVGFCLTEEGKLVAELVRRSIFK